MTPLPAGAGARVNSPDNFGTGDYDQITLLVVSIAQALL